MWWLPRGSKKYPILIYSLITCLVGAHLSLAVSADPDVDCTDLALVFLRGSGQNNSNEYTTSPFDGKTFGQVEPESYSFFNWFKTHLDEDYPHVNYKAVTVHDFPNKYDPVGYKAAGIGVPQQIANTANAEVSWIPGDYRNSVDHGINETAGYLKDQIAACPNQSIAVGGYSQGAQVMGESLFRLTEQERSKIVGVGLFGDPKFIASTDNPLDPFDHPTSYPWRRGDATNADRGMLDARIPYLPSDLEKRTTSYCYRVDLVCSGWSGARGIKDVAHGSYSGEPMRNTVSEIVEWAAPKLMQYERNNGGTILPNDEAMKGAQPDNKQRDIMFLINDDSNLSVIQNFRYQLDRTLYPIAQLHPNTQYAARAIEEADTIPHFDTIQSFLPYTGYNPVNPMFSVSNLQNTINKRYPFGQLFYGSGDTPNPLGMAVEKAVLSSGWRADSTKHLILFTDRPLKETYVYSVCQNVMADRSLTPTPAYINCPQNPVPDTWPKTTRPELCETAYMAITQDTCINPTKLPGTVQKITRTLNDEITIAQSQNTAVTVVVPFNVRNRYSNQQAYEKAMQQLELLAKSTGGKFVYYDKSTDYSQPLLSDTLYQIFGHTPKQLVLTYKENLDNTASFTKRPALSVHTNKPVVLDVSQTSQHFDSYKWDFDDDGQWDEVSPSPVVQHEFNTPQNGYVRIAGVSSDSGQTETKIALAASVDTAATTEVTVPTVPEVTATQKQSGEITLNWQASDGGYLLANDPETHQPIAQAPLKDGTTTFDPRQIFTQLELRVVVDDVISDPSLVQVKPEETVPVTENPTSSDQPPVEVADPTLCYKLQQCQNESASPDSYNPQPVHEVGTEPTAISVTTASTTTVPTRTLSNDAPVPVQQAVQGASTEPTITKTAAITPNQIKTVKKRNYTSWLIIALLLILTAALLRKSISRK